MCRDGFAGANGVFRSLWYVSFQKGQRGLASVDPQPAAGLMHVFLDRGLGQPELHSDFLVGEEGGQPQALFLTRA